MGKRDWAIFFLAIALTVLGVVRVFVEGSIETGAWGLSFRQEGSAPIGPAGVDQLRQYDAAYLGDTRQKRLYLTFDAGYENGSTEKILDTLKAHGNTCPVASSQPGRVLPFTTGAVSSPQTGSRPLGASQCRRHTCRGFCAIA